MFDFSNFREHPRPMSSYTDATNLIETSQGADWRNRRSCSEVQPFSPRAPGSWLLETSRFPVIKNPLSSAFRTGFLIGGNRLAQEESR